MAKSVDGADRTNEDDRLETVLEKLESFVDCVASCVVSTSNTSNSDESDVLHAINGLEQKIDRLQTEQSHLLRHPAITLIPDGPFLERFRFQYDEKQLLCAFVAWKFFSSLPTPFRYFVQASSTALHLGLTLTQTNSTPHNSLIYTNSAVMPLATLYGHVAPKHTVWTFCGHDFDSTCAGWLIPLHDHPSFDSLRDLFRRPNDPLTTAFLMPRHITMDNGLFYERRDAAAFADSLSEARDIVILATGDRILQSQQDIHSATALHPALQPSWNTNGKNISLVVSDSTKPLPPVAEGLRKRGITVYWLCDKGWCELPANSGECNVLWSPIAPEGGSVVV